MSRKRSMLLVFRKDPSTKDAIESHLRSSGFEIKLTRELDLLPEQKVELHKRNAALGKAVDGQTAYAVVLEHPDAIARWTTVSRQALKSDIYKDCYASSSEAAAKEDILWLKGYLRKKAAAGSSIPTAAGGNAISGTKTAKESSRQQQRNQTPAQRSGTKVGASRTTSVGGRLSSTASRRSAGDPATATTTKRGVSARSESMTSTGRRGLSAPSRVPVKASSENVRSARIAANRKTPSTRTALRAKKQQQQKAQESQRAEKEAADVIAVESDPVAESISTEIENLSMSEAEAEAGTDRAAAGADALSVPAANDSMDREEEEEEEEVQSVQGELYPSDKGEEESEHDAEVAAAMQYHNRNASAVEEISTPSTLRASLSPNSISSLPRPETPEVDQLRQRFESIAQSSASLNSSNKQVLRRSSGSSPEIALKGKDIKPKSPAGSRVKSMVEFFMDENLHKWEF